MAKSIEDQIIHAAKSGNLQKVQRLLNGDKSLANAKNAEHTVLNQAAFNGHLEIVRLLLENGAKIEIQDKWGDTPLTDAAYNGHTHVVVYLLQSGANPDAINNIGDNAATRAHKQKHPKLAANLNNASWVEAVKKYNKTPEEVIFHAMAGLNYVEDIYNFRTMERTSFIRTSPASASVGIACESFHDLQKTPGLRKAFEEHARRGGTVKMQDIDFAPVKKARLMLKQGQNK
ncbi:MAG: ankyrin repeat domain-containing protein [Alphaproteobacteria bacterium]|nr:ankyrin repeat domain-containing protein [Alphaproteobacteria bacterium]